MWYLLITRQSQLKNGSSSSLLYYHYGMCYCIDNQITSCYFSDNIYELFEDLNQYTKPCGNIYNSDLGLYIQSFINSEYCTVLPIGKVMEDAKVLYSELFI